MDFWWVWLALLTVALLTWWCGRRWADAWWKQTPEELDEDQKRDAW